MPELASPFRLRAAPGPPGFDGQATPGAQAAEEVPDDGTDVLELTAETALIRRVGIGSVAGIRVGMEVRSTLGYAAAQFRAKPHPVNARKETQVTIRSMNPIKTP
jgi:hypothetical protein